MYKILIVEDDHTISSIVRDKLNKWGYDTLTISDFSNVIAEYTAFQPHLVLMDINLPYYDGFFWCSKIRQISKVPIIFISSRDTEGDKIRGITQGGDDYIEKPFSLDMLIVKVQAMLRRAYSYSDEKLNVLAYRDIILNIEDLMVFSGEREIRLTHNECKILSFLIRNSDKIVSRPRLIKALWDDESFVDDNTLTVNINRLRKKLKELRCGDYIETIKGEGYKLI
ncbi:response regulator transcription factor [Maledivibacter halophilus]|uniref:Stage 0 sporulation protein A homolog n=1 Tax=Maledivibacter halophilus TaxID=36842 RepID=A0A1T5IPP9_9FIRM|nr:response regulator transcription factor [Maledivibacter halophilus]SKC41095.1 DNA-binding response regulator, OmpR family, contains REC and winged-helix (wHTH) domain [Maledivibacter halophilus]